MQSLKIAIDAMGGELEKYLEEAEGKLPGEEEKQAKPTALQRLRTEFIGPPRPKQPKKPKKPKVNTIKDKADIAAAKAVLKKEMFNCFKNYKKQFRLIMW